MTEVQDGQYYPEKAKGGHSRVSTAASGDNTLEVHEFYNENGKVIYYWKIIKDSDGNVLDFRLKIPEKPQDPTAAYVDYDNLS